MENIEIEYLKTKVASDTVYWKDPDSICYPVKAINHSWVEFADEPDLTEPAAILTNGKAVALYNVYANEFVTLEPVF